MPRPSLEVFKARLDGALGSLGCCEMWRLVALRVVGGWSFMIFEVPSNPSHAMIPLNTVFMQHFFYHRKGLFCTTLHFSAAVTFWSIFDVMYFFLNPPLKLNSTM